jgi:MoxR-like ATPase
MDPTPILPASTSEGAAAPMDADRFVELAREIETEVGRVIVGQADLVRQALICLLGGGHALLEGVPGLGKTLLVRTIADVVACSFNRIQFTPDLMPADITGTNILVEEGGSRVFRFQQGPIFANLVLADEINRATPKTQSALLEAMQEHQVTAGGHTYPLPEPFYVLATQNPIEQEGTYPLPEAQVDRFMLMIKVGYPSRDEERAIMDRMTYPIPATAQAVVTPAQLLGARDVVNQIYIDDKVKDYIVSIVFATRKPKEFKLDNLQDFIRYGASPRASINLNLAARAHAFLRHRGYVTPEDVKAIGPDVLRHRIILSYEAEAEEVTTEDIVRRVFEAVEVP